MEVRIQILHNNYKMIENAMISTSDKIMGISNTSVELNGRKC
jgi:hypothetical protein